MGIVYCAACEGKCSDVLDNCPHCGHPISGKAVNDKRPVPSKSVTDRKLDQIFTVIDKGDPEPMHRSWNPAAARVLSFFIPGLGQIYRGKIGMGLVWLFFTIMGYLAIIPGIILHLGCIYDAGRED